MAGYTLMRRRSAAYQRTSAEGGGGGTGGSSGGSLESGTGGSESGENGSESGSESDPPKSGDDKSGDKGFPANTPVAEMTWQQQAAYWRDQSKTQQARVPKDLDALRAKAAKWDEYEQTQQTPADKAVKEAEERGRKAAAADSAMESLRVILQTRGKEDAELDDLLSPIDPNRFVTEAGQVDRQKVKAFADKLVPDRSGGGGGYGQGRHERTTVSGKEKGRAEAQKRFAKQQQTT